jgi:hypothetical protein
MSRTHVDFPQSIVRAGVARGDITPPVGIYHRMWGAATHDRSTGVHRPLTATALVLAPADEAATDGRPAVFLAVDHCLLWTNEMRALLAAVAAKAEVPQEQNFVFFSHTHAAGLMGLERCSLPGGDLIPGYLTDLADKLGDLVRQALVALQPASIVYGTGRCDLATNRDYLDEERGEYVCGFNPGGIADDTVVVARITARDDSPLATIVNYACHPTTLAWENTLISPDYIGAMREVVESATRAPCFFIQGASGDIGPREGFVGDVAVADRNGRRLGYAALAALESLPAPQQRLAYAGAVVSGATLGPWRFQPTPAERRRAASLWQESRTTVALKYRDDLGSAVELQAEHAKWEREQAAADAAGDSIRARDARAMIERATRRLTRIDSLPPGESYPYPIRAWRLGDAVWLALDGEHYNVLQRTLRERFPETPIVVGTIANGSNVWYLPDAGSYGKGLYQESASVLAKGSLESLVSALITTVHSLTTRKPD